MRQPTLFDSMLEERVVVFDLETQKSFQDVGGRENLHLLRVSIGVLFDCSDGTYHAFREDQVGLLLERLRGASLVVGYNCKAFDYPVLAPYCRGVTPRAFPTLDLMEDIARELGFRVGLDNVATATLGRGKSAGGLDAIRWFREGAFDLLEKYCRDDVEVTRLVYEHGRDRGCLKFKEKSGQIRQFHVRWRIPKTCG